MSTVVFQFGGSIIEPKANEVEILTETGNAVDPIVKKTIEKINNSSYYDRLNSWLGQTLQRDFPQVIFTKFIYDEIMIILILNLFII